MKKEGNETSSKKLLAKAVKLSDLLDYQEGAIVSRQIFINRDRYHLLLC